MSRPRLLDLFAGAGGCSVGYDRAGFDVMGVDSEWHPTYPYRMVVADAMAVLADRPFLDQFDAIHASPPCQAYSALKHAHAKAHPELVEPVRRALVSWGGPYIIENVVGAPLVDPVQLCGSMFNLGATCRDGRFRQLRRHRLFESNMPLAAPPSGCQHVGDPVGVYGHGGAPAKPGERRGYQGIESEGREAMGIHWMKQEDLSQAIPPAYTEHLGRQLVDQLDLRFTEGRAPLADPSTGWSQPMLEWFA